MSKAILITGASRGLGAGLARHFAARGYKLALTARSLDALDTLADTLKEQSPQIVTAVLDVADYASVANVINQCAQQLGGLDIIVANAGVAINTRSGKGQFEQMRKIIDVNLTGAIASAEAAIELFRQQGHGQLVGISSVAAARGLPGNGAYSASKAGFSKYLEALRAETANEKIVITELAPGYIDTDLNSALASRPFLVSAEKGTGIMADLIEREVSFRYVPPWPWTVLAQLLKILPTRILKKL